MNDLNTPAIAALVPDSARLDFLPSIFGVRAMMRGESLVYDWMGRLSEDYSGGYWNFYEVSNGARYLAPRQTESLRIAVDGNGFVGAMSADAAGIVATLFALNQLAAETEADHLVDLYYQLRDFAAGHEEHRAIFAAID